MQQRPLPARAALTQPCRLLRVTQASDGKAAAGRYYTSSIASWPGQSEAHFYLAQGHLAAGRLDAAEEGLRAAAAEIPARLGGVDGALLQEQRDRAEIARYDLALLLAQRGGQAEASRLARALGFGYRLSAPVLCPGNSSTASTGGSVSRSSAGMAHVVDNGVSAPLLDALRAGFAPGVPFWYDFCIQNDEICIQNDGFCITNYEICIQNDEFCITNDGFCINNDEFCIKNDELCILNDEICIQNDEFCIKNDEFCIYKATPTPPRPEQRERLPTPLHR